MYTTGPEQVLRDPKTPAHSLCTAALHVTVPLLSSAGHRKGGL